MSVKRNRSGFEEYSENSDCENEAKKFCAESNMPQLPEEMWLKIFNYVGSSLNDILTLTKVCKNFSYALEPKLKLVISRNYFRQSNHPEILRTYGSIKFHFCDIDTSYLKKLLRSSTNSAKKLEFSKCKMHEAALQKILRYLPNVREITMNRLNVPLPYMDFERTDSMGYPDFSLLRKLNLKIMNLSRMDFFFKIKSLEELGVDCHIRESLQRQKWANFIASQKTLKVLQTRIDFINPDLSLPDLNKLEISFRQARTLGNAAERLAQIARISPKLEYLKVTDATTPQIKALLRFIFPTVKTLVIKNLRRFEVPETSFPALEKFLNFG